MIQNKRKLIGEVFQIGAALLMTAALSLDLGVVRAARPEAVDLFGFVYQILARTFDSVKMEPVALAAVFAVCWCLCRRYLLHKPSGTAIGEYILCAFLAVLNLASTAARSCLTVAVLWSNGFQVIKAGLFAAGWFFWMMILLRALHDVVTNRKREELPNRLCWLEKGNHFWKCFAVLLVAWLPHMIARYPGVLMWDSYLQINQFMGLTERWANHPPFGTLLYGTVAWIGQQLGRRNLVYAIFTLTQCLCFIAVLSYSLLVLKRLHTPGWLRLTALVLYAVSPCYVGWGTVIAKDSTYLILYLLMITLMLVCLFETERFFRQKWHIVLLGFDVALLALTRHNGMPVAAAAVGALAVICLKNNRKGALALVVCAVISLAGASGVESLIQKTLDIQSRYIPDVMSLPFQQTAMVALRHREEIPPEEAEIIDTVIDYYNLPQNYSWDYADGVKDTYRQEATAADRAAYWKVWFKHLLRYPVDYLDATMHMNGVLFDLQSNAPMYICFSDMEINEYVYPWSFNDMKMYESEPLRPLNSANRALTEGYMEFHRIPLLGMAGSMSFHTLLMIAMLYLTWTTGFKRSLVIWLPSLITMLICLFAPVVYLRYALPYLCASPLGVAAYMAHQSAHKGEHA